MQTKSLIIITAQWTNPETEVSHKPGEVTLVPSYMLQRDGYGIDGKYRQPMPWEPPYEIGKTAPVVLPPHPDEAKTVEAPTAPKGRVTTPPED